MDVKNIHNWCRQFTAGRTEIHDEQVSGKLSISEETVARLRQPFVKNAGSLCWFLRFGSWVFLKLHSQGFNGKVKVLEGVRKIGTSNPDKQ